MRANGITTKSIPEKVKVEEVVVQARDGTAEKDAMVDGTAVVSRPTDVTATAAHPIAMVLTTAAAHRTDAARRIEAAHPVATAQTNAAAHRDAPLHTETVLQDAALRERDHRQGAQAPNHPVRPGVSNHHRGHTQIRSAEPS